MFEEEKHFYRVQLKRDDFLNHGYMEGCPGCQAALSGTSRQGHSEGCRSRVESAIRASAEGPTRITHQHERYNLKLARRLEEEVERAQESRVTE